MNTPNTPKQSINAWTILGEDNPSDSGYTSFNSSYQSLIKNNIFNSLDMLNICFFVTVPDEKGYWTIEIGNKTEIHPDGSSTEQYLQNTIRDARKQNSDLKILATLSYNAGTFSNLFSKNPEQWPDDVTHFANNLKAYLVANKMNGCDIDWEAPVDTEILQEQFKLLFTAIRKAFNSDAGPYLYLTLSPADPGYLDGATVNSCFDFVNLQLYCNNPGFCTKPQDYLDAGVHPQLLSYGSKFELKDADSAPYQDADGAYNGMNAGFQDGNTQYVYQITTQWRLNSGNFVYEQSQQVLLYQFVHGIAASSFNDINIAAHVGNPPIMELNINSGEVLDAIRATNVLLYDGKSVPYPMLQHGGNGGNPAKVKPAAGDYIVEVSGFTGVWYGWNVVAQISIKTKSGTVYGPFGSMSNVSSKVPFSYVAPQGQSIIAFSGSTVRVPEAGGGESYVVSGLKVSFA